MLMERVTIGRAINLIATIALLAGTATPAALQQAEIEKSHPERREAPTVARNTSTPKKSEALDPANPSLAADAGASTGGSHPRSGGLWLTGNLAKGLALLRWIVGPECAEMLSIDESGRVSLSERLLDRETANHAESTRPDGKVTRRAAGNEGLLLLSQIRNSRQKYMLYIGSSIPTLAGDKPLQGAINLDNKYDSRITRIRTKADMERPPTGF